jgi:hypothetical protein
LIDINGRSVIFFPPCLNWKNPFCGNCIQEAGEWKVVFVYSERIKFERRNNTANSSSTHNKQEPLVTKTWRSD